MSAHWHTPGFFAKLSASQHTQGIVMHKLL